MSLLKSSGKKVSDAQSVAEDRKYLLWSNNEFFLRESFKTLRTNVTFALADTEGCKVIAVTSGMQGEGKSTIAANLAMSFVDLGKRVLIVDCDLRRPKLATLLECQTSSGLTNAFIDLTMLKPAIVRYSGGNLDVLPCGSIPPNPSELLNSRRMATLLETLRGAYDYIIIDLPPVGAVIDAVSVSRNTDGMIVVIRENHCPVGVFKDCVAQIQEANVAILGFVINGALEGSGKKYGYGSGYSSYKSYGGYYGNYYGSYYGS